MPRNIQSQWDFGELFPADAGRRVLTVSELTQQVRRLLEGQIGQVWVTGEVTNLRAQSSGHVYFTLKDAAAQLNCVLFRNERVAHREWLQDGQKVLLQGDLTVYEARGQYQLIVRALELRGVGALQLAFEKLKQRLLAEGWFAPERKRPLPRYPRRIGLVTSPTGAAIRDVLHVIQRRHAGLEIVLAPCRVQGEGAGAEIAGAIRLLQQWSATQPEQAVDLIVVTRGGGSLEDLWAFNEEVVARAIYESALPVVSAVGHEIDFTISDFVADLRAATPSAAAELITEGFFSSRRWVAETTGTLSRLARGALQTGREDLENLVERLHRLHPRRHVEERRQLLDELEARLFRRTRQALREHRRTWHDLRGRLSRWRPLAMLDLRRRALADLARRLSEPTRQSVQQARHCCLTLATRLRLLSPENVLERGYSITTDAVTGQVLRDAARLRAGQTLRTRLHRGEVLSEVTGPGTALGDH
jgi:exodeoxyribonuclease VII large subunit